MRRFNFNLADDLYQKAIDFVNEEGYKSLTALIISALQDRINSHAHLETKKVEISKPKSIQDKIDWTTEEIGRIRETLGKKMELLRMIRRDFAGGKQIQNERQVPHLERRMWNYIIHNKGGVIDKNDGKFYTIKREDVRLYCHVIKLAIRNGSLAEAAKSNKRNLKKSAPAPAPPLENPKMQEWSQ